MTLLTQRISTQRLKLRAITYYGWHKITSFFGTEQMLISWTICIMSSRHCRANEAQTYKAFEWWKLMRNDVYSGFFAIKTEMFYGAEHHASWHYDRVPFHCQFPTSASESIPRWMEMNQRIVQPFNQRDKMKKKTNISIFSEIIFKTTKTVHLRIFFSETKLNELN